jgi:hypothetical protein
MVQFFRKLNRTEKQFAQTELVIRFSALGSKFDMYCLCMQIQTESIVFLMASDTCF